MNILVTVSDTTIALTDADLAELNKVLAKTPTVNRYDNDKVEEKKRIKLEATMIVKTRTYSVE